MITEGSGESTLAVAIVLHDSDLERLASTLRCLSSALQFALGQGSLAAARVVLRDNASSPVYVEQLRQLHAALAPDFPVELELSLARSNVGYGAGVNAALNNVCEDVLLVLNPDIELAEEAVHQGVDWLGRDRGTVALGPLCHSGTGGREFLCKRYPSVLDLLLRGFGGARLTARFAERLARYEYRDLNDEAPAAVELLSGACMLMHRRSFAVVGGFDERFFMYFEDFDLSLRLGEHGKCFYVPAIRVVHHGGNASRKGLRHIRWFAASAVRFYRRHGWRWR